MHTDIQAAIVELKRQCPEVKRVVLAGLCDGASAALIASTELNGVDELALINPWVHTSDLEAALDWQIITYRGLKAAISGKSLYADK